MPASYLQPTPRTSKQSLLPRSVVLTCTTSATCECLLTVVPLQFTDYGKGEPFRQEWHDFLGDSIFTTDLDMWHASRQLIRPQFIKDRVSDLGIFEEHVQVLLREISKAGMTADGTSGGELDVSDLLFR